MLPRVRQFWAVADAPSARTLFVAEEDGTSEGVEAEPSVSLLEVAPETRVLHTYPGHRCLATSLTCARILLSKEDRTEAIGQHEAEREVWGAEVFLYNVSGQELARMRIPRLPENSQLHKSFHWGILDGDIVVCTYGLTYLRPARHRTTIVSLFVARDGQLHPAHQLDYGDRVEPLTDLLVQARGAMLALSTDQRRISLYSVTQPADGEPTLALRTRVTFPTVDRYSSVNLSGQGGFVAHGKQRREGHVVVLEVEVYVLPREDEQMEPQHIEVPLPRLADTVSLRPYFRGPGEDCLLCCLFGRDGAHLLVLMRSETEVHLEEMYFFRCGNEWTRGSQICPTASQAEAGVVTHVRADLRWQIDPEYPPWAFVPLHTPVRVLTLRRTKDTAYLQSMAGERVLEFAPAAPLAEVYRQAMERLPAGTKVRVVAASGGVLEPSTSPAGHFATPDGARRRRVTGKRPEPWSQYGPAEPGLAVRFLPPTVQGD